MMYDWDVLMLIYDGDVLMDVLLEFLFEFLLMMRCHHLYFMLWLQPSSIAGVCCQPACWAFAMRSLLLLHHNKCMNCIHNIS